MKCTASAWLNSLAAPIGVVGAAVITLSCRRCWQDVFRGMYPFVALQVLGLMLCIYYPGISLWLPRLAGFLE